MTDQIKNQLLLELLSFFENAPVEKIRAFDNVVNKKDNSLLANFLVILNSQAQGKAKYKIDDKTLEVLLKQTLELNDPQKNSFDGKKLIDLLLNQEKYICDHLAKSYLPLSFWRQVRKNLNSIYQTKKYNNQEKIEFFINVLGFALTNNEIERDKNRSNHPSYYYNNFSINLSAKKKLWLNFAKNILDFKPTPTEINKLIELLSKPISEIIYNDHQKNKKYAYDQNYYKQNSIGALLYNNYPEILLDLSAIGIDLSTFQVYSNYQKYKQVPIIDYLQQKIKISKSKSNQAKYERLMINLTINNSLQSSSSPSINKLNKI